MFLSPAAAITPLVYISTIYFDSFVFFSCSFLPQGEPISWDIYDEFHVSNLVAYYAFHSVPLVHSEEEWTSCCKEQADIHGVRGDEIAGGQRTNFILSGVWVLAVLRRSYPSVCLPFSPPTSLNKLPFCVSIP